jgi:hypothetical protein
MFGNCTPLTTSAEMKDLVEGAWEAKKAWPRYSSATRSEESGQHEKDKRRRETHAIPKNSVTEKHIKYIGKNTYSKDS